MGWLSKESKVNMQLSHADRKFRAFLFCCRFSRTASPEFDIESVVQLLRISPRNSIEEQTPTSLRRDLSNDMAFSKTLVNVYIDTVLMVSLQLGIILAFPQHL